MSRSGIPEIMQRPGAIRQISSGGARNSRIRWQGGALVDLHDSLAGACADKATVWAALTRDTATMRVADALVEAAGPAANALIVALHAANNGPGHGRSCEDLSRALEVADDETW